MNTLQSKVAVIGLGLMGGSLGLSLTRAGLQVSGWDYDLGVHQEAFKIGAINKMTNTLPETVADAELVFVATPVDLIPEVIHSCVNWTQPGTIFSDLGSIKQLILEKVNEFLPETHYFVPGHPMTGSEQQGIIAADPFLFQNAAYILIENARSSGSVLSKVKSVIALTGAHLLVLDAAEHDRIVGMVSHLPHLVAAILAKTAGQAEFDHPGTLNLAAGGFRDTTRVATGAPEIWEGIIFGNKSMVLQSIDAFEKQLTELKQCIDLNDQTAFFNFLTNAREVRMQIPGKNKGFLTLLHEMVVTIEDRPGTINNVLQYLAAEQINIKDIEILRVREGDGGTLRLALEDSTAVDRAVQILNEKGFKTKKR